MSPARRSKYSCAALALTELLLVFVGLLSLPSCAEAKAVSPAGSTSDRWSRSHGSRIDQVRLGFGLDLEGRVSPGCTASKFALRDPIHLSMLVSGATPGSVVRVSVRNTVTQSTAWSDERPAPPGRSYLTFEIGRGLPEGRYRAESTLGDEATRPQEFVVHAWHDKAR